MFWYINFKKMLCNPALCKLGYGSRNYITLSAKLLLSLALSLSLTLSLSLALALALQISFFFHFSFCMNIFGLWSVEFFSLAPIKAL